MSNSAILKSLQAETLLAESYILKQIEQLKTSLRYKTDGKFLSFDDYYISLENQVDDLPKLKLQPTVATGTENQYIIQLISGLEGVLDNADRVGQKMVHYEAKLKDAASQIKKVQAAFGVWYTLAAVEVIAGYEIPLPASQVKALADAEFSRLMDNLDTSVNSLILAVKATNDRLKMYKKTQQEKFSLGKDQANATWTSSFPAFGTTSPEDPTPVIEEPEEISEPDEEPVEEAPAFVSRKPQITPPEAPTTPVVSLRKYFCRATTVPCDLRFDTERERDEHEEIHIKEAAKYVVQEIAPELKAVLQHGLPTEEPKITAPADADDFAVLTGAVATPPPPAPAPKKDKPQRHHTDPIAFRVPADGEAVVARESDPSEKIKCVVCDRRIRKGQTMFQRDGGWAHTVGTDCTERDAQQLSLVANPTSGNETQTPLPKIEVEEPPVTKDLEVVKADPIKPSFEVETDTLFYQMQKQVAAEKPSLNDLVAQTRTNFTEGVSDDVVDEVVTTEEPAELTATQIVAATEPPEVKLTATPRKRITFLEDEVL